MMKFTKSRWLAGISTILVVYVLPPSRAHATNRPRYGGTLRVELRAASVSLDPREWKSGSLAESDDSKLAALVFDSLVTLDDFGRFQPALASEWTHDSAWKSWQFKLRPGTRFSDGTPLTAADVATALESLLPPGFQVNANEAGINIRATRSLPDLLEQLASGRYFIFRALPGGKLLGTGPFYVGESIPATPSEGNPAVLHAARMKFHANEQSWAGRPFVDTVEVTLGEPPLRQLLDLQMGKADLVEVAPDLVRKARQDNLHVWSSAPNTLLALRFDEAQAAGADERLREAVALALDRDTMANVLLQRQAEPASALLPQWLSGYAFLFESSLNLERAKQIRAELPANEASAAEPLRLRVDAVGDLMKLLGERVAVNVRQANLTVQLVSHAAATAGAGVPSSSNTPPVGLHLFAWHYDSLSPSAELGALVKQLHLQETPETLPGFNEIEQRYTEEGQLLLARRVLPLVVMPEYVGLSANLRNWMPARWGEWRLADVWLEQAENPPAGPDAVSPRNSAGVQMPGVRP